MQISLNQNELEEGVRMYIESQGISLSNCDVQIAFTAGRGSQGTTATVDIEKASSRQKPAPVATNREAFQPQQAPAVVATPVPREEAANVAEPDEPAVEEPAAAAEPNVEEAAAAQEDAPFEPDEATTSKKKSSLFA